jgi:predicted ATPase
MAVRALYEIHARNFLSLRDVTVSLGPLNVLVGPNGAGKSNLLDVIQFLGDSVREDLGPAVQRRGGYRELRFRGDPSPTGASVQIHVKANVTRYAAATALDEYDLQFWGGIVGTRANGKRASRQYLRRNERFQFKRRQGRGRRLTIKGEKVELLQTGKAAVSRNLLRSDSLGLSTLPRLSSEEGGDEVRRVAELFSTFRVFEVDTRRARMPVPLSEGGILAADASNLAAFLYRLQAEESDYFEELLDDARAMIPGFDRVDFRLSASDEPVVELEIKESQLRGWTSMGRASYGTVRILSLLAMLYDPDPPLLTCVEEIDHGLHPYVFDRLVDRLRWASGATQFLIATHSPTLVNRLDPSELIVCEKDQATGESVIPAVDPERIAAIAEAAELRLGELWFSGSLRGVPT